jgi:hypothetical protein
VAVRAVIGWARTERALRERLPLPAPRALQWLAGGVLVFAGLAAALVAAGFVLSVRRRLVELEGGQQASPVLPIVGAAGVTLLSATGGIAVGVALWLR